MDAFLTDQLSLLGLNEGEVRVFMTLATFGRMNITRLAARAALPRTTVDYMVKGMVERDLVVREKIAGHWEYSVPLAHVAAQLDTLERKLVPVAGEVTNDEKFVKPRNCNADDLIAEAYQQHTGDRVTVLLGQLTDEHVRMISLEKYFTNARASESKVEIITTKDVAQGLSLYAKEILALLACVELRLNVLPNAFCIEGVDITLFRDEVFVVHHRDARVERITGPLGVDVLRHLMFIARETAWSVDIRHFLAGYVEGKPKT